MYPKIGKQYYKEEYLIAGDREAKHKLLVFSDPLCPNCTTVLPELIKDANKNPKILALYSPEARDLRQVVSYLKITNELLRASTNTRSFIKGFTDVCSDVDLDIINQYAIPMQKSTTKAMKLAISILPLDCNDEIQDICNDVLIEESKTDDLYEMVEKSLFKQASKENDFEKFHNMLRALRKSEKIADRATSIANLLLYIKIGGNLHH
jgi:phosphate transport system protein